jgi:hypothetical protein
VGVGVGWGGWGLGGGVGWGGGGRGGGGVKVGVEGGASVACSSCSDVLVGHSPRAT